MDNYSNNRTKEIVLLYCHPELVEGSIPKSNIHFYTKGPERSAQRNYGVEKSKGDYFLYLDADMILSKNVIRECVEKITFN